MAEWVDVARVEDFPPGTVRTLEIEGTTGAALSPPAYEPVATFPMRVEGGMVRVRDDRWMKDA
jgi:nitrite reductase/ring-hydroxylating ferredoxin subunit